MLLDANLENLKRCVRNNEKAPGFDLTNFRCGSYGCLVGNDAIATNAEVPVEWFHDSGCKVTGYCLWAQEQYGIQFALYSESIFGYLFGFHNRHSYSKEACIGRLKKLIAYVERKRAIMYEADGRVSELARRREGNWEVCASVLSSLAVAT